MSFVLHNQDVVASIIASFSWTFAELAKLSLVSHTFLESCRIAEVHVKLFSDMSFGQSAEQSKWQNKFQVLSRRFPNTRVLNFQRGNVHVEALPSVLSLFPAVRHVEFDRCYRLDQRAIEGDALQHMERLVISSCNGSNVLGHPNAIFHGLRVLVLSNCDFASMDWSSVGRHFPALTHLFLGGSKGFGWRSETHTYPSLQVLETTFTQPDGPMLIHDSLRVWKFNDVTTLPKEGCMLPSDVRAVLSSALSCFDRTRKRFSVLHTAVLEDDLTLLKWLLDHGAPLDVKDERGSTALLRACDYGRTAHVALLLAAGANPFEKSQSRETSMYLACLKGYLEIAELLLNRIEELHRIEPTVDATGMEAFGGWTPLHAACVGGKPSLVRLLLDRGFSPSKTTIYKQTPLHVAAFEGRVECVRLLLESGADPSAVDASRDTPLTLARKRTNHEVVECLERWGVTHCTESIQVSDLSNQIASSVSGAGNNSRRRNKNRKANRSAT